MHVDEFQAREAARKGEPAVVPEVPVPAPVAPPAPPQPKGMLSIKFGGGGSLVAEEPVAVREAQPVFAFDEEEEAEPVQEPEVAPAAPLSARAATVATTAQPMIPGLGPPPPSKDASLLQLLADPQAIAGLLADPQRLHTLLQQFPQLASMLQERLGQAKR